MKEFGRIDFGSIHIYQKALAEIIVTTVNDIDGLSISSDNAFTRLLHSLGIKRYSAVVVSVDKNNQVSVEVKVRVRYGLNIPEVARHAQEIIREAVERTANDAYNSIIDLKDIHINVLGIERRPDNAVSG